jgi:hypothetical protein
VIDRKIEQPDWGDSYTIFHFISKQCNYCVTFSGASIAISPVAADLKTNAAWYNF